MLKRTEMALPVTTKSLLKTSPDAAMLFAPLRVHPPTSPCPALSAHAEPKYQGHCPNWHHEAESLMMDISAMGPKELINQNHTHSLPTLQSTNENDFSVECCSLSHLRGRNSWLGTESRISLQPASHYATFTWNLLGITRDYWRLLGLLETTGES